MFSFFVGFSVRSVYEWALNTLYYDPSILSRNIILPIVWSPACNLKWFYLSTNPYGAAKWSKLCNNPKRFWLTETHNSDAYWNGYGYERKMLWMIHVQNLSWLFITWDGSLCQEILTIFHFIMSIHSFCSSSVLA